MADIKMINYVFNKKVIWDLIKTGRNSIFDYVTENYILNPEDKTYGELFSEMYSFLRNQQRNEYYYMNTLFNFISEKDSSLTAFSQLHIGRAIADFVVVGSEERVYEIKSDLDSFVRLRDQIGNYFLAFSSVSVLTSVCDSLKVKKILSSFGNMGEAVGIYVLSEKGIIFRKNISRKAEEYNELLDHGTIFKLLRKREYGNIIFRHFGKLPEVQPVFYFSACLTEFSKIPIKEAQRLAFHELKKRKKITAPELNRIQPELKSVIYFSDLSRKIPELERLLMTKYK